MCEEETVVKQWQLERIKQREMPHKLCQLWATHTDTHIPQSSCCAAACNRNAIENAARAC